MVAGLKTRRNSIGVEARYRICRMGASRLMNENRSLFSHADLQIQFHTPDPSQQRGYAAESLHETASQYRTRSGAKKPRRK
jgi:hypothetical protein